MCIDAVDSEEPCFSGNRNTSSPEVTDEESENFIRKWSEGRKLNVELYVVKYSKRYLFMKGINVNMFVVDLKEVLLLVEFVVHVFTVVVFKVPLHLHHEEGVLYKAIHNDIHVGVIVVELR